MRFVCGVCYWVLDGIGENEVSGKVHMQVWSPPPSPRSPARTRTSTPHNTPPVGGSAPTLRPRMLPAARRPALNDALHAAMSLHNTTLCAIHNSSTLHTHAHTMRERRDARARDAASPVAERARHARQHARARHKVATNAEVAIAHQKPRAQKFVLRGFARRPGTAARSYPARPR